MRKILTIFFVLALFAHAFAIDADLGEVGVGARPLSLGKAYVGMPTDASAIFMNPAGLAYQSALKITTMTGKLLNDVTYISAGGAIPVDGGDLGIAYINASTTGIPLTTLTHTATQDIITQQGVTDYQSSVMYLSYAQEIIPRLMLGANLKMFLQGFSQSSGTLSGANGNGFDMDLGALYNLRKEISIGGVVQNLLPTSMGGKFTWANGQIEGIPAVAKLGLSANILGDDGFYQYKEQIVKVNLDSENAIVQRLPGLWHLGCEWGLNEYFTIRAGVDQMAKAADGGWGVDNNLTGGIGLKYRGFSFDYAYHQYGDLTDNATHYFSLGFVGVPEKVKQEIKKQKEEKDQKLLMPTIKIKTGIKSFNDVKEGFWAKDAIEYLATLGMIGGYPDNTFRPDQPLTRAELATLLVKAKGFEPKIPESNLFADVPTNHWAAPYISVALDHKYISGYPDGTFLPWKEVNRAEAVVVLSKFDGLSEPLSLSENPFPDVFKRHWAARWIAVAKNAGLLEYLSGKNFEPDKTLTRAEAAEIISKTDYAKAKIIELLKK